MLSPDQLDNWFTYHPPTEETAPKYAAIRSAEDRVQRHFAALRARLAFDGSNQGEHPLTVDDCAGVNVLTRAFVEVIDANAPDGDDKSAAIRCVRIARNAMNEWVMSRVAGFPLHIDSAAEATRQLVMARWQANGAIACGGR